MTTPNAVTVFTAKSLASILAEGGSGDWKLDAARAKKCEWLVCTQNAHNPEDYADGTESHGSAFLVGKISRITPAPTPGRWTIEFSEYAHISEPDVWTGDRNPVRYTTLDALGIDVSGMSFQKIDGKAAPTARPAPVVGLTIVQAKAGLAATYDVDVDSIEIVIRG